VQVGEYQEQKFIVNNKPSQPLESSLKLTALVQLSLPEKWVGSADLPNIQA
jgi:hypothetical protein